MDRLRSVWGAYWSLPLGVRLIVMQVVMLATLSQTAVGYIHQALRIPVLVLGLMASVYDVQRYVFEEMRASHFLVGALWAACALAVFWAGSSALTALVLPAIVLYVMLRLVMVRLCPGLPATLFGRVAVSARGRSKATK